MQTDLITKVYFNEHLTHSCVGMPQGLQALLSSLLLVVWFFNIFQVVVGNVLDRRKFEVVMVTKEREDWIRLSETEQTTGVEIEKKIVEHLTQMHQDSVTS